MIFSTLLVSKAGAAFRISKIHLNTITLDMKISPVESDSLDLMNAASYNNTLFVITRRGIKSASVELNSTLN